MVVNGLQLLKSIEAGYVLGVVSRFGENLARIRKARRLKTKELAAQVRVKSPTVSQWEREPVMPETPTLLKLAKALRCSVDALLEGVDPEYEVVRGGRDLIRHAGDLQSGLPQGGPLDVSEVDARVLERLIAEIRDEQVALRQMRTAVVELGDTATRRAESLEAVLEETTRRRARGGTR